MRVQLILRGCSSYCGGAARTVEVQLILWGCSLYCEDAACTVRMQLILLVSVLRISTSPILYSAGNGSVWPANVAITLTVRV